MIGCVFVFCKRDYLLKNENNVNKQRNKAQKEYKKEKFAFLVQLRVGCLNFFVISYLDCMTLTWKTVAI